MGEKKGISILGTGDFTHKKWREELKESLISTGDGFYKLKDERIAPEAFHMGESTVRFVVSGEISCIYKKNGKTRKAHHVIILPGFEAAERFASDWKKSEIYIRTEDRFLDLTAGICLK